MKDSVDRQAVVEIIAEAETYLTIPEVNWYTIERVLHLPSTEPEIIRCKDCYHYPSKYADCPMIGWARNENDFCSKAERKDDD